MPWWQTLLVTLSGVCTTAALGGLGWIIVRSLALTLEVARLRVWCEAEIATLKTKAAATDAVLVRVDETVATIRSSVNNIEGYLRGREGDETVY